MKTKKLILLCAAVCIGMVGRAQNQFEPAWSNLPGCEYPQITSDGQVRVQLKAPDAKKVQVCGGEGFSKEPVDLIKDEEGNWTATLSNVTPGFHYYWFMVYGIQVNDPFSAAYFGYSHPVSGLYAATPNEDFLECKDVPHGMVREHWYFSQVTGKWRRAYVYTPAGYDANTSERYPILYLLHGAGENERGWSLQGRMNFILDNLIAEKKAQPMVVVMDNGYAVARNEKGNPGFTSKTAQKRAEILMDVYKQDIIPTMESFYRIKSGRENRAIAGLSMGGFQTLFMGLNNIDMFSYIGAFSAALVGGVMDNPRTAFNNAFANPDEFNQKIKVFWFGAGSGEKAFHDMALDSKKKLEDIGIKTIFYESPNTYHEWHTWSRCLYEFAPLLFK